MKKILTVSPLWLFVAGLFALNTALAVPPPGGNAPVEPPPYGFAIDGDLMANVPELNVGDWITNTNLAPGTGGSVLTLAGLPINPSRTFHLRDPYSANDNVFKGGMKWRDNPNLWQVTTNKASSKTDINNALLHLTSDTNGHIWAVVAADRFSTSGDSYIDFEFLQSALTVTATNTFASAGTNGGRTVGDLVFSLAFVGGGSYADFFAFRWQTNGFGGFTYADVTDVLPVGKVFLAFNSNTVAVPYGAFNGTTYDPNAFVEAAIDLTALLGNFDQCATFGFKTIMIKTKSSSSDTATIEDYITPFQYTLRIGPDAQAGPDQARCTEGVKTIFPLTGTAGSGLSTVASTTWSVVSGDVMIDNTNVLVTTAHVSSASATLRLTVVQANGCTETDDIVLSVQQPPVCAINGVTNTCLRTTNTFTAPVGMTSYAWSVSGGGFISGAANQQTVKVVASSFCGTNYTLSLNLVSNVCSAFCSQDVAVIDTGAPVLICPTNRVLDCPANTSTNNTGTATATDSCSRVAVTYSDAVTAGCGVGKVIARTWTATDECGNAVSCVQTITVRDITPPVITCPTNRVLQCPADTSTAANGVATAIDACGAATVTFNDVVTTNCGNTFVIARTWTATDLCNNSSSCLQTITVRDTTAPVITCPPSVTLQCPADTSTNANGMATATDACGSFTMTYTDTTTNNCGGTMTIARRWTATDQCGNSSSCTQTITVRDTTPPVITCAGNKTVECTLPWTFGAPSASDTCGTNNIVIVSTTTNKTCGNTFTAVRTWRATDACGNQATCSQTVTVVDTTAPTITCVGNKTIQCSTPWTFDAPSASDTCGTNSIAIVSTTTNANCGNTFVATRIWRATDACGNQATCSQTVTMIDTIAPVITCPASLTLNCPAITTTNATGVATATDTCGTPAITFSDSTANNCGNTKIISRTWRATDPCGNSSTCVQTITVRDIAPPTMTTPTNLTVECGASIAPSTTGQATATDACNAVNVSFNDSVSNSCGNARTILRRWVAMDSCSNSNVAVQTITVRDTTPPVLTLPPNRTLNCPGNTNTSNTGVATATDACGSVTISYSEVVSNNCGITKSIWRTWKAVDQCGNQTSGMQTIVVVDTAPTMSCPSVSVQCVDDVPPPYTNIAAFRAAGGVANDPCDANLDFVLVSNSVLIGSCPARMTRVYRVTDDCGLTAQCTQTVIVDDTIAPTLTCLPSVTVECGTSLDTNTLGSITATDNCSAVVITRTDNPVSSFYNLKWYGSDPDLGTGPYSPTYLRLGPASLPCPTGGRAVAPLRNAVCYAPGGQLDALTSLGGVPLAYGQVVPFQLVIEVSGAPGAEKGVIEVTPSWSTHTTSNDRFGFDTNYMVYCAFVDAADPGSIDPHFNAKVDSLNSYLFDRGSINEQIRGTLQISGLDSGDRIVVEIWMVMQTSAPDHVGGTIASEISAARKLSIPAEDISIGNETISIGNLNKFEPLPPPQPQPPAPPIPPQPPVPPGTTTSVIDRTWAATDDCGNRSTCVQRITVRDTTAPSLIAPNLVLECPADTSTNGTGMATVFDACGLVTLGYSDVVSNSCANTRTILRTWTARDDNKNTNSVVQTISVVDTTAPTLSLVNPKSISAGVAIVFDTPNATDSCGSASVVEVSTVTNALTEASYTITRTWVAVDACANKSAPQSQVVTVNALVISPLNRLTISRNGVSGVLLRWPTNALNYRLECSTVLDAKRWSPVAITPIVTNGECRVYLSKPGHCQLFRLANSAPYLESQKVGGSLRLTWPTVPSGFQLEASDTLAPGSWSPVAVTPGVSNTLNHVNLAVTGAKKYYRLKK